MEGGGNTCMYINVVLKDNFFSVFERAFMKEMWIFCMIYENLIKKCI